MANQYRSVLASGGASTGGDALPTEVLSGKTFTNDNGAQTGTMTNNGAVTQTLAAGASYTIPEGYHNGEGTVTATSQTYTDITSVAESVNTQTYTLTDDCLVIIISSKTGTADTTITINGGANVSGTVPSVQTSISSSGCRAYLVEGKAGDVIVNSTTSGYQINHLIIK